MDTLNKVINLVKPKDWAISIDLRDAYLHVPLFPKHRQYLRFCIQGRCYQWKTLCFGPTSAPRVFTKIVSVVAAILRAQSIRVAIYLDDWLVVNQNKQHLILDRGKMSQSSSFTRFHNKQSKIMSSSKSENNIFKGNISPGFGHSDTNNRENRKIESSIRKVILGTQSSKRFSSSIGDNGLMHRFNTKCSSIYETNLTSPVSQKLDVNIPFTQHLKSHLSW
jgi:hypothetical protein